jgi:hypothetical protein
MIIFSSKMASQKRGFFLLISYLSPLAGGRILGRCQHPLGPLAAAAARKEKKRKEKKRPAVF